VRHFSNIIKKERGITGQAGFDRRIETERGKWQQKVRARARAKARARARKKERARARGRT
jgi:hypothetical protein